MRIMKKKNKNLWDSLLQYYVPKEQKHIHFCFLFELVKGITNYY